MEVGAIFLNNLDSFAILLISFNTDNHLKNQGEVDLELFHAVLEDLETNASKIEQRRKREVRSGE